MIYDVEIHWERGDEDLSYRVRIHCAESSETAVGIAVCMFKPGDDWALDFASVREVPE